MTQAIFYEDAYRKNLRATVTAVDGDCIELDRTIFYSAGGGQPGDTGVFVSTDEHSFSVIETRKGASPGSIVHRLDTDDHDIQVGDVLVTELDWERRYHLMKMHTGMHLLGSLVPVGVTGGAVGIKKSRLDFDLGEHQVDKDKLNEELQALVGGAHEIEIGSITEKELDESPELVRTMSVQPPRGAGTVRMVRIRDVDYQPCGGTHVANTNEIGALRVSKIENKGKRNRRFHLVIDD